MAEQEVPRALRRLWDRPARSGRPRRGPKPALSAQRIVRAAADIADADGLAAVSMARIAESLGCTAMALYRHVESKDELFTLLAEDVAASLTMPRHGPGWRAGLEAWTRAQIDAILDRPWFLDLPLATVPPGPSRMRWVEHAFAALEDVDLPGDEKLGLIGLLAQHALAEGRVQLEARRAAAADVRNREGLPAAIPDSAIAPDALAAANPLHDYDSVLSHLADPADYPATAAALARIGPVTGDTDAEIDFGLQIVLDGIEAYVGRRAGR